ncbi:MAG: glycosyl transferase family protein, partial [Pseudomonadota bacterium]|nr:glycosyl transferase family protein [Pseudomonadota bacterium]
MIPGLALEQSELLWDYFDLLHGAAVILAVLILISAADDLFLDACYWARRLSRRLRGRPLHDNPTLRQVRRRPERPMAIMVPAWQEHDVIAKMLENMVSTLDYERYVVFVGTYPNDERTIAEVSRMKRRYRHLVRVEVPSPGPTCKADCLNAIVRAIFAYEKRESTRFAGAVLHDCEDVLDPIELRYFNYMLDRHDLIQIPVVALERKRWDVISGTYMDEFAEWHGKDLVVREMLTGTVPSAGVGTCFSRRALAQLDRTSPGEPFNTATLTEDYDIAERLARAGLTSTIGIMPVPTRIPRRGFRRSARSRKVEHPLCVREYFPNSFRASYRQKARWTLGISLQGWAQLGWSRSLAVNYFLFRDRKVLVTSLIGVAVYFIIFNLLLLFAAMAAGAWNGPPPELFYPTGWFGTVVSLNVLAFFLRLGQRAWFVSRLHGWENGLMAVPRLVIGTFVNAAATIRALRQYFASQLFGTKLVWDKTMHEFPAGSELRDRPQRLGEILLAWRAVDERELEEAHAQRVESGGRIGQLLVRRGAIDEETLAEAIAYQSDLPRASFSPARVRATADHLPRELIERHRALPLGREDGRLLLGVGAPLSHAALTQIQAATGAEPVQHIIRDSELEEGLGLITGKPLRIEAPTAEAPAQAPPQPAGPQHERLARALLIYEPDKHGAIDEFLLRLDVVEPDEIDSAFPQLR